jgi:hypothetical protein
MVKLKMNCFNLIYKELLKLILIFFHYYHLHIYTNFLNYFNSLVKYQNSSLEIIALLVF